MYNYMFSNVFLRIGYVYIYIYVVVLCTMSVCACACVYVCVYSLFSPCTVHKMYYVYQKCM